MSHRVREYLEEKEESLSPYAAKSRLSRGRLRPEEPSPMRTAFQRDRDRIIHCNAFRRLKHKTQVFIAPTGDHYVTRLTHTLEVSQVARSIARALNLNEDLTEAISLGHDLGHTPFGHIGEDVLNKLSPGGFRHNEQSLRVVDLLENNGRGLNLTWEVREGILHHSKTRADILGEGWGAVATLEGQVCKLADSIAYINHDIGDAIRAAMIAEAELPAAATAVLGHSSSERINTLVTDIVEYSWSAAGRGEGSQEPNIGMSPGIRQAANVLRDFLFERVYNIQAVQEGAERARKVVDVLYGYFSRHPEALSGEYKSRQEPVERSVVDYIAGMTDNYALQLAQELSWGRKTYEFDEKGGRFMQPGDVRIFEGKKAIVAAFGVWAARGKDGWLHIHMTGDNKNFHHITVVNNPLSKTRYNRVLFRDLRRLLIAHGKWLFGDEGAEK